MGVSEFSNPLVWGFVAFFTRTRTEPFSWTGRVQLFIYNYYIEIYTALTNNVHPSMTEHYFF